MSESDDGANQMATNRRRRAAPKRCQRPATNYGGREKSSDDWRARVHERSDGLTNCAWCGQIMTSRDPVKGQLRRYCSTDCQVRSRNQGKHGAPTLYAQQERELARALFAAWDRAAREAGTLGGEE